MPFAKSSCMTEVRWRVGETDSSPMVKELQGHVAEGTEKSRVKN